jgi:hypothetical protein
MIPHDIIADGKKPRLPTQALPHHQKQADDVQSLDLPNRRARTLDAGHNSALVGDITGSAVLVAAATGGLGASIPKAICCRRGDGGHWTCIARRDVPRPPGPGDLSPGVCWFRNTLDEAGCRECDSSDTMIKGVVGRGASTRHLGSMKEWKKEKKKRKKKKRKKEKKTRDRSCLPSLVSPSTRTETELEPRNIFRRYLQTTWAQDHGRRHHPPFPRLALPRKN